MYPKEVISSAGNPSAAGIYGYRVEGMGYPAIYNIARDPRERMNQIGTSAWVIAPYLAIIKTYEDSLEKYPNPPGFSLTEFSR